MTARYRVEEEGEMGQKDPRIDAYIAKSRDFAKPILKQLRAVVHEGCPQCEETLKWSMPAFTHDGIVAMMAAFRGHCAFVLWKGPLITGAKRAGMGSLGKITSLDDLPSKKVLVGYVKKGVKLNELGVKSPTRSRDKPKKPARVPPELKRALAGNAKARAQFAKFSPSSKREYCEWISGAKGEETRARRLRSAIETISQGKPQNWKYMKRKV